MDEDCWIKALGFLDARELVVAEECCSSWKNFISRGNLWRYLLEKHLLSIHVNVPSSGLLMERVKVLSMSTLRKALSRVSTRGCIEKGDFERILVARLFLRGRNYPEQIPYKTTIPDWCLAMNPYKSGYYFLLQEAKRCRILLSEVCSFKWSFSFKHATENRFEMKFDKDFTVRSQLHVEGMIWQVQSITFPNYLLYDIYISISS